MRHDPEKMANKIPVIKESALLNSNARTVIEMSLGPLETVFPHYHNQFSETFNLLEGNISVFQVSNVPPENALESLNSTEIELSVEGKSATIHSGVLHKYQCGPEGARVRLTLEPGAVGFERSMCILRGLQRDEEAYRPSQEAREGNKLWDLKFMAILADLSDGNPVGQMKKDLEKLYKEQDQEVENMKNELLSKYAEDEMVMKSVGL